MYGRYWHSLVGHAPLVARITSLRSVNTEQQERTFGSLKDIAKATTSRRPGQIIPPCMVRLQAEQSFQRSCIEIQESEISKFAAALPSFPNTIISHHIITKHPRDYQAHLERISDFLLCGEGCWWRHDIRGVEFFDSPKEPEVKPEGPALHHFRSTTLKDEYLYLRQCWNTCADSLKRGSMAIPHTHIKLYDCEGEYVETIHTNFMSGEDSTEKPGEEICDMSGNGGSDPPSVGRDEGEDVEAENAEELGQENEYEIEDGVQKEDGDDVDLVLIPDCLTSVDHVLESDKKGKEEAVSPSTSQQQSPQPTDHDKYKTTLVTNLSQLLPEEPELLLKLDKSRQRWKQNTKNNLLENEYKQLLAVTGTRVLKEHSRLQAELKHWDKTFCYNNNYFESDIEQMKQDKDAYKLFKRLRRCEMYLEHWGISLHQK